MYTILFMHYPDDDTMFPTMATKLWDTKEEATKSMENIAKIMAIGPEAKYEISENSDRIRVFNKEGPLMKLCVYKIPDIDTNDSTDNKTNITNNIPSNTSFDSNGILIIKD